jgi:hypothetical protein
MILFNTNSLKEIYFNKLGFYFAETNQVVGALH